ncbi:MAG: hypothetical protein WBB28_01965 [Crinalium sp.]
MTELAQIIEVIEVVEQELSTPDKFSAWLLEKRPDQVVGEANDIIRSPNSRFVFNVAGFAMDNMGANKQEKMAMGSGVLVNQGQLRFTIINSRENIFQIDRIDRTLSFHDKGIWSIVEEGYPSKRATMTFPAEGYKGWIVYFTDILNNPSDVDLVLPKDVEKRYPQYPNYPKVSAFMASNILTRVCDRGQVGVK